jgi:hypothetical protein
MDIEEIEAIVCPNPQCNFIFSLFEVMYDDEGNPTGLYAIEKEKVHEGVKLYCPRCGIDIKNYENECNIELDHFIKWKQWTSQ